MEYKIDTTPGSLSIDKDGVLKSPDIQTENGDLLLEGLTWERSTNWKRNFIGLAVKYYHSESTIRPVNYKFINETKLKIKAILTAFLITSLLAGVGLFMAFIVN